MRSFSGSTVFPLTAMMADTIRVHGLRFAVRYYSKKIPAFQLRVLLRAAYL